jgi:putative transposase
MTFATHKIALDPTTEQTAYFVKACGVARFAYNWALAEWNRMCAAGEKPSEGSLRKKLNAIKDPQFPWMREVTKSSPQEAVRNLGIAFGRFFAKKASRPKFKKKGVHDSFCAGTQCVKVVGCRVRLPRVGWVRMRECLRFAGHIVRATVSHVAGRWFVALLVDTSDIKPVSAKTKRPVVGIDLGVRTLATLSTGEAVKGPKALRRLLPKLRRLSRSLMRKVKGSANRRKAKERLAKLHYRIGCVRGDATHKITTRLARGYRVIGVEGLNVRGMLKGTVSRGVADAGFGEFRRQLVYKCGWYGSTLIVTDRFFASTKTCCDCGAKNDAIGRGTTFWVCPSCGAWHDRDVNAAVNLERHAARSAASACGGEGSGARREAGVKPAPTKQEAP